MINARTDAFMGTTQKFDDPLTEAIRRLKACEAAGSRCSYPVRAPDADALRTLIAELDGPVNTTAPPVKGAPAGSFEELKALGVQRITCGPLLQSALTEKVTELVSPWR